MINIWYRLVCVADFLQYSVLLFFPLIFHRNQMNRRDRTREREGEKTNQQVHQFLLVNLSSCNFLHFFQPNTRLRETRCRVCVVVVFFSVLSVCVYFFTYTRSRSTLDSLTQDAFLSPVVYKSSHSMSRKIMKVFRYVLGAKLLRDESQYRIKNREKNKINERINHSSNNNIQIRGTDKKQWNTTLTQKSYTQDRYRFVNSFPSTRLKRKNGHHTKERHLLHEAIDELENEI